ncbi:MAG: insulinase family protein [Acidobacteria bacterium]|jgi:zinc protease|nr:insulinase family protein [Acidobacteriota bacterium]
MKLIVPLAAALLAATPGMLEAERLSVPYEMFRLPNGLTVIVHEDHSAPIATVNTWYHVGSGRETPGRTGFAHLFEHLMFEGSGNVPEGQFDRWLEAVGGTNNGSTSNDRTNYWENVPSNAVEMPLFLESDRMGYLLDSMSPETVDGQRDVVKNERRQSYENRPYGIFWERLPGALFPEGHPYSWPVIGSMADLSAASYEDVVDFFKKWYGPANASVVIAGDVDTERIRRLAEKWFGEIPESEPVAPLAPQPVVLTEEKRVVLEDRVQLPRVYLAWPVPAAYSPPSAALDALASLLADGKNSRLYRRLVYDLQVAQDVNAFQDTGAVASTFLVMVTARSGHSLEEILGLVDEEIARLKAEPPTEREIVRFQNRTEAAFFDSLERVGGFGGKADQLNDYYVNTGNPDYFEEDLARYLSLDPSDVRAVAARFLGPGRVVFSVVPEGKKELAVAEVTR